MEKQQLCNHLASLDKMVSDYIWQLPLDKNKVQKQEEIENLINKLMDKINKL